MSFLEISYRGFNYYTEPAHAISVLIDQLRLRIACEYTQPSQSIHTVASAGRRKVFWWNLDKTIDLIIAAHILKLLVDVFVIRFY